MSDRRIGIDFDVNSRELEKLNKASSVIENFQRRTQKLINQTGAVNQAFSKMEDATNRLNKTNNRLVGSVGNVDKSMERHQKSMNRYINNINKDLNRLENQTKRLEGRNLDKAAPNPRKWDESTGAIQRNTKAIEQGINKTKRLSSSSQEHSRSINNVSNSYKSAKSGIDTFGNSVDYASKQQSSATRTMSNMAGKAGVLAESQKGLNKYTLSWAEALSISATRMLQWTAAGAAIFGVQRLLKNMGSVILEVDDQMTELKKVMDEDTNFDRMLERSTVTAKEFGRTITDVNEAFIEFGRQGLNEDQIELMAKATNLLANVGDIDAETAASRLTGTLNIFKKDYREATDIVDRFNEVQNNYATTVPILTEAVGRAGASAKTFGVTLEENIGHITAIGISTRESGSIIGNSLKTIYSRITTMDDSISALESVGIRVFNPMTEDIRPVNDLLTELAGKWDGLSESEKQHIAVQLAGRYQLTRFLALMDNYDTALSATETATNSWGSAMEENQVYMESIRAHLNKFIATAQETAIVIGENGLGAAFKASLSGAKMFLDGMNSITRVMGPFSFTIPALTAGLITLGYNFNKLQRDTKLMSNTMHLVNPQITSLGTRMGMSTKAATVLSGAIGRVTASMKAMMAAAIKNPFTWIGLAVGGLVSLAGKIEQTKQRQEELEETARNSKKEYEQFVEAINNKTVDDYQINKFNEKVEMLGDILDDVEGSMEKNVSSARNLKSGYNGVSAGVMGYTETLEELNEKEKNRVVNVKDLGDKTLDLLAQMEIYNVENKTYAELMDEIKGKQDKYAESVYDAEKALKKAKEEAVIPSTDAYFDMADSINENATAMENLLGIKEGMVKQIEENIAIVELLSQVRNKNGTQTKLLSMAEEYLADVFGDSREEVKKNLPHYRKQKEEMEDLKEKVEKVAGAEATKAEVTSAARDLEAFNKKKNDLIQKRSERSKAETMKKSAKEQEKNMGKLKYSGTNLTDKIISGNKDQKNSWWDTTQSVGKNIDGNRKKIENLRKGHDGDTGKIINKNKKMKDDVSKSNEEMGKSFNKPKSKLSSLGDAWDGIKEKLRKPILGTITMTIKGIFGGLFGSGGGIDSEALRQKAESSLGGLSSAGGFGKGFVKTSGFGPRWGKMHKGVDFGAPTGTPIPNQVAGKVLYAGYGRSGSGYGGYGNVVHVQGLNGMSYLYAHMNSLGVKSGQMVKRGQNLGGVGSTGNSTGPHLHFEIRRNGTPLNPSHFGYGGGTDSIDLPKYHTGGIVGYKPPNPNEQDARLLKGEMVLTEQQQSRLFKLVAGREPNGAPMHEYHNGGIVGGIGGGVGAGTDTYRIKWGDTLSELAVKFKTTTKELMKLNKNIKNANRIYAGEILKIPKRISAATSKGKVKNTPIPTYNYGSHPLHSPQLQKSKHYKVTALLGDYSERSSQADYLRSIGGYSEYLYQKNMINYVRKEAKKAEDKRSYNRSMIDSLGRMDDLKKMNQMFKKSKLFLPKGYMNEVKKELDKAVSQNVLDKINKQTSDWLNNFNKGLKDAHENVRMLMDAHNQMIQRKMTEKTDAYIEGYRKSLFEQLGVPTEEEMSELERLESRSEELMERMNLLAEESGLLEWRLKDPESNKRLKELEKYMKETNKRISKVENDFKKRGVKDRKLIREAQEPLRETLAELQEEYNELNKAMIDSGKQVKNNEKEIKSISKEYKKLQEQIESMNSRREFTDPFGNIVRDAEGNAQIIDENGARIVETYRKATEEIIKFKEAMYGIDFGESTDQIIKEMESAFGKFESGTNLSAEVKEGEVIRESKSEVENRTYQADTNVTRNVTYVVNTGVALASESELREFAILLKEMMDEEEGRSQS